MKKPFLLLSIGASLLAIVDGIAKYIAITRLPLMEVRFGSVFRTGLYKNLGIAFDIPIPHFIVIPLSLFIAGFLIFFAVKNQDKKPISAGFALVAAIGALGNLIDRVVNGFTTDYLIFFERSAINISDILIVIGILVIIFYTENKERR